MSSRVEKAGSKFRPSLGRRRIAPAEALREAAAATTPPRRASLQAATAIATGPAPPSPPPPAPAPIASAAVAATPDTAPTYAPAPDASPSVQFAELAPRVYSGQGVSTPLNTASQQQLADASGTRPDAPPSDTALGVPQSSHEASPQQFQQTGTPWDSPNLSSDASGGIRAHAQGTPSSLPWGRLGSTPGPSPGPGRARTGTSRLSLAQPQALASLASRSRSGAIPAPALMPTTSRRGPLPPQPGSSSPHLESLGPGKSGPLGVDVDADVGASTDDSLGSGAHRMRSDFASRKKVRTDLGLELGGQGPATPRRRRRRPFNQAKLPSVEQERQQWELLQAEHAAQMEVHRQRRAKRAEERQRRRAEGLDVDDTTSESDQSEPELVLPASMQGPGGSTSMADLTGMRWTRGLPGPKTFVLAEKYDAWKASNAVLAAKAQRHLERRIANGDEYRQKDVRSDDSEPEGNDVAPESEPEGIASDAAPNTDVESQANCQGASSLRRNVNPVEEEEEVVGTVYSAGEAGAADTDHEAGPSEVKPKHSMEKAHDKALASPDANIKPTPKARKFRESGGAAQFRMRDDGTIDVDPSSLLYDRNQEAFDQANNDEVHAEDRDEWTFTNSASYVHTTRRGKNLAVIRDGEAAAPRNRVWTPEETRQLLSAISLWGTDFGMIARAFPDRTRAQIKAKYRKLDLTKPALMNEVLSKRTPLKRNSSRPSSVAPTSNEVGTLSEAPNSTLALPPSAPDVTSLPPGELLPATMDIPSDIPTDPIQQLQPSSSFPQGTAQQVADTPDSHLEVAQGIPRMSLEAWAQVARVDLDAPMPIISVPDPLASSIPDAEPSSSGNLAMKRSRGDLSDDEYEEEEEIEILPDGTRSVRVVKVRKRHSVRRSKSKSSWRRDRAHRADVMASQAGAASGEYEEVIGSY